MSEWLDFKEVRSKLVFPQVIKHYDVRLNFKGDRATGFCPLPTHQGQRKSPSFSADLKRGIWQCFGCRARGNVLDFACRMEGFNPDDPQQLRQGALKVKALFLMDTPAPKRKTRKAKAAEPAASKQVLVNEPIDFELQTLDCDHPYLRKRGFTDETIRHFGLGFCNRGMLKYRIAIPLHDPQGPLVGYAGRIVDDGMVSEKCPKYLFPGSRERNGITLEFRKSLLLYNAHQIDKPVDQLIVVEGFPSVWWLWQHEYRNVVALMGADCSDEQAKLIIDLVKPEGKVWVMPDGNDAGGKCAVSVLGRVAPHRLVRWVRLGNDEQPTDCAVEELAALFSL